MSGSSDPRPDGRTTSYRMEDLDAPSELARLDVQVRLLAAYELAALRVAGVRPGQRLLDLGCGPGFFAESVLRGLLGAESGEVVGVDLDESLLAIARERQAQSGLPLRFHAGSALAIPLPDASVDVAYARFLFQHLADPRRALAEMRRVVRPGGLVVVGDTDDGGLVVFPAPEGFDRFLAASRDAQAARGGDRAVGRKLRGHLLAAGLLDVHVSAQALSSEDIGPAALVAIAVGFKAGVLREPFISAREVARVQRELVELSARADFYGHAIGYLAWGRRPHE